MPADVQPQSGQHHGPKIWQGDGLCVLGQDKDQNIALFLAESRWAKLQTPSHTTPRTLGFIWEVLQTLKDRRVIIGVMDQNWKYWNIGKQHVTNVSGGIFDSYPSWGCYNSSIYERQTSGPQGIPGVTIFFVRWRAASSGAPDSIVQKAHLFQL